MTFTTRFAPSPTGPLHLGHAYSALLAFDMATAAGGRFLLRIEDIDRSRARPEWEAQIKEDLNWLGIVWEPDVLRQSENMRKYDQAIDILWSYGILYQCDCSRRDIESALSAPQEGAPQFGPDGVIYPGTCRYRHGREKPRPNGAALRLDMATTVKLLPEKLHIRETLYKSGIREIPKDYLIDNIGDIVISRRDMGTSYHLSVVLDDTEQGITDIVRGEDLFEATTIHVLLQNLLDLPTPVYHHHKLIRDDAGKRLAKRDDARAIAKYRADGASPQDIRQMVGLPYL